jgi:hypothetical protein
MCVHVHMYNTYIMYTYDILYISYSTYIILYYIYTYIHTRIHSIGLAVARALGDGDAKNYGVTGVANVLLTCC